MDLGKKFNVLNTDAPYLLDKLTLYKHEIWNECMTFLGINNANTDKKQVVLTPEIESNNDLINFYLNCFYEPRKRAIDLLNEKFGLDIKVDINRSSAEEFGLLTNDIGVEDNNG